MTAEIYYQIASFEHMDKQPQDMRYALFCKRLDEQECDTVTKGGHIGDFSTFDESHSAGLAHEHSVRIEFFPDPEHQKPSIEFMNAYVEAQALQRVIS